MRNKINKGISSIKKDGNLLELIKSGGFVLFFKVLGALSGLIFSLVVTRTYGAATYGVFEFSFTVLMIASVVVKFGLDTAILRYTPEFINEGTSSKIRSLYFRSILLIGLSSVLFGGILFSLRKTFSVWFSSPPLADSLIWVSGGIILFSLIQFNAEALRGFKKLKAFSIFQQGTLLIIASAIFFALKNTLIPKDSQGVAAFVFSALILLMISFVVYLNVLKRMERKGESSVSMKKVLTTSLPMLVSGSLFLVISWTDTIMIGYFESDAKLGIYRIAFRVGTLITFIQFAVNSIAAPVIADHYSSGRMEELKKYIRQIGVINAMFAIPIFLIIVFFKGFFLQLFGAEFQQGFWVLPVLAIGQLVNALCGPVMYILNMTGKEKVAQNIMIWIALANLVLNFWLIPLMGIMGAAIATSVTMVAWNIIAATLVYKYYGIVSIPWIRK